MRTLNELRTSRQMLTAATIQTSLGIPIVTLNTGSILYTEFDDTTTPVNETTSLYLANWRTENITRIKLRFGILRLDVKENEQSGLERWEVRAIGKSKTQNQSYASET